MSGMIFDCTPHGWKPGKPVESAEGCLYPTWAREESKPKKTRKKKSRRKPKRKNK